MLADPQAEVLELSIIDVLYAPQIPLRLSKIMFVIIQPLSTASVRILLISVAWKIRMAQLDPERAQGCQLFLHSLTFVYGLTSFPPATDTDPKD